MYLFHTHSNFLHVYVKSDALLSINGYDMYHPPGNLSNTHKPIKTLLEISENESRKRRCLKSKYIQT